ncbi:MAG: DHA2 family efflux MFS transporter permease subunit [Novosphingobium sp.]|nr:DHA2 family efflux MFS transporter permease subunit [Novosphingobium sp.]
MALLDISIVNSALPVIQGEIGATQSEGTWVGTSYLVAEIVIMPLTAWLERMLGLRRVLLIGATIFTIFSVVCGFASDLTTMILGRIGQGLAGGTLIPTGMTIMAKRLPPHQQSIGMAIFASAALLGPILGPLLGGWITENYSWHYAFFINVPICAGLVLLILTGLPGEPGDPEELTNADWFGIAGMALGFGSITVLLEEGHREQWFESALIWQLAVGTVIGIVLVAVGQLRSRRPVMKLGLLRDRALSAVLLMVMVNGALLFGTLFTVPQFLAAIAGYNALQSGQVIFIAGLVGIFASALYPVLVARIPIRIMVASSMVVVALASYVSSNLTSDSVASAFRLGQILLGVGVTYSVLPLQQAAVSAVPVDDAGQATSLFNIARNLGASIGLAALASFFEQRIEFHHWRVHSALGANDPELSLRLAESGARLGGGSQGMEAAYRALDAEVMTEALVMSFSDIFLVFAALPIIALPLVLLLRPIDPEHAKGMAH